MLNFKKSMEDAKAEGAREALKGCKCCRAEDAELKQGERDSSGTVKVDKYIGKAHDLIDGTIGKKKGFMLFACEGDDEIAIMVNELSAKDCAKLIAKLFEENENIEKAFLLDKIGLL